MKIVDSKNLITDHSLIENTIRNHPFIANLDNHIQELTIRPHTESDAGGISINHDQNKKLTILYVYEGIEKLTNYEYIIYHEFGHIADRVNPIFKFSEKKKASLEELKRVNLKEVWNLYIDSRLYHYGLFQLGENDKNVMCKIDGKFQIAPFSVEGKLLCHISFLQSRNEENAENIVRDIWNNPLVIRSYEDLINLIK